MTQTPSNQPIPPQLIKIPSADLVALDDFAGRHPLTVDLVYARGDHPRNIFKTAIYRPTAKMWAHRDLARVIVRAADLCFERTGWTFELKDCLRTVEAQEKMRQTEIVKKNPHWLEEPNRLLSPPGLGAHPRGMAVDIVLLDAAGREVDMGTEFDYLTEDRANNPAARSYRNFPAEILKNRQVLEDAMVQAGRDCGMVIYPLPQEWWDFRFMPEDTQRYAPICDADLPPSMQMTGEN